MSLLLNSALARLSLRPALSVSSSLAAAAVASSSSLLQRPLHTSSALSTWGGRKPKSHGGATKRFKMIGSLRLRPRHIFRPHQYTWDSYSPEATANATPEHIQALIQGGTWSRTAHMVGPMFKRSKAGRQHLNIGHSSTKRRNLRRPVMERSGSTVRLLKRLMGPAA